MNRLRKALKWAAIGVPILMALTWVFVYFTASNQIANALASLKAAGYATSLAEMAPPMVPADRNGAPDYVEAFALRPDPEGEDPALEKARELPFAQLTAEEKVTVLEILGKAEPYFAKLRSGRKRGSCRYERDYGPGLAMQLPDVSGTMGSSMLLRVRAQTQAASGRTSEARESVRDILALADAYRDDPLQMCMLVRLASLALAVDAIHLCVDADTSESDLRAWREILPAQESLDEATVRGLRGELASAAQLAARPHELLGSEARRVDSGLLGPWWKMSLARYLGSLRRAIEMAREKPYLEARIELNAYVDGLKANASFWDVCLLLFPATGGALDRQRVAQASLEVLRAGLSAEIERAAAGKYPERLDVPDPLSGRPLLYKEGAVSSAGVPGAPPEDVEKERLTWKLRKK